MVDVVLHATALLCMLPENTCHAALAGEEPTPSGGHHPRTQAQRLPAARLGWACQTRRPDGRRHWRLSIEDAANRRRLRLRRRVPGACGRGGGSGVRLRR